MVGIFHLQLAMIHSKKSHHQKSLISKAILATFYVRTMSNPIIPPGYPLLFLSQEFYSILCPESGDYLVFEHPINPMQYLAEN